VNCKIKKNSETNKSGGKTCLLQRPLLPAAVLLVSMRMKELDSFGQKMKEKSARRIDVVRFLHFLSGERQFLR
jgi:hypothetical protein